MSASTKIVVILCQLHLHNFIYTIRFEFKASAYVGSSTISSAPSRCRARVPLISQPTTVALGPLSSHRQRIGGGDVQVGPAAGEGTLPHHPVPAFGPVLRHLGDSTRWIVRLSPGGLTHRRTRWPRSRRNASAAAARRARAMAEGSTVRRGSVRR